MEQNLSTNLELREMARNYCPHCPFVKECVSPLNLGDMCKHLKMRVWEEDTLNMLAERYNVSPNEIWIDDAEFLYVYYLNDKQIYAN